MSAAVPTSPTQMPCTLHTLVIELMFCCKLHVELIYVKDVTLYLKCFLG